MFTTTSYVPPFMGFFLVSIVMAVLVHYAKRLLDATVFLPAANMFVRSKSQAKFREGAWLGLCYTFTSCFAGVLVHDNYDCWQRFGFREKVDECKHEYVLYFELQQAIYIFTIINHIACNTQKDFRLMLAHHTISVLVIPLAYFSGHGTGTVVVLLLHDLGDIFLQATKLLYYAQASEIFINLSFALLAITFFATRLVLFPLVVYRHYIYEAMTFAASVSLYSMLLALYFMHIYWFGLIAAMIRKALVSKQLDGDIRSDDEGDEKECKSFNVKKQH